MDEDLDDLLGPSTPAATADVNPLRAVLMRACPPDPATGQKSVLRLSKLMNLTDEAIFKWCRQQRIPPLMAARVVDLAEGRVTLADFSAFIFLENLDA